MDVSCCRRFHNLERSCLVPAVSINALPETIRTVFNVGVRKEVLLMQSIEDCLDLASYIIDTSLRCRSWGGNNVAKFLFHNVTTKLDTSFVILQEMRISE